MRYQTLTKVIAWIEMISSTALLLFMLIGTYLLLSTNSRYIDLDDDPSKSLDKNTEMILNADLVDKLAYATPGLIYAISEILLGSYLLKAAEDLNYKKLRTWFIITATYSIVIAVLMIPAFLGCDQFKTEIIILVGGCFLFTGFSLFVVNCLRAEIKKNSIPVHSRAEHQQQQFHDGQKDEPINGGFNNYIVPSPPPAYEAVGNAGVVGLGQVKYQ